MVRIMMVSNIKDKIITGIVVLTVIALISGVSVLAVKSQHAAASPGTENDPFIVLSYLTGIFRPQIISEINKTESNMVGRFNERIAKYEKQDSGVITEIPGDADVFSVVVLSRGQTLTCSVGTEIMLRIGSATGFGTTPALVNYTTGTTLSSGTALTTNHMYLITIEGNGVTATANTVRLLVRGSYTIT